MALVNCECGCGAAVEAKTVNGDSRRFAPGHNMRKRVLIYCAGEPALAYVHDRKGICSRCKKDVSVVW